MMSIISGTFISNGIGTGSGAFRYKKYGTYGYKLGKCRIVYG
jgi:hypothetical protein